MPASYKMITNVCVVAVSTFLPFQVSPRSQTGRNSGCFAMLRCPCYAVISLQVPALPPCSGGFIKRDGRPKDSDVLVSRLVDRPIRPMFAKGWANDTQVGVGGGGVCLCVVRSGDSVSVTEWHWTRGTGSPGRPGPTTRRWAGWGR